MYFTRDQILSKLQELEIFTSDFSKIKAASKVVKVKRDPELFSALQKFTNSDSTNPTELLYRFIHPEVTGLCEICNKPVKFENFISGYRFTCGNKKCVEASKQKHSLKKYGILHPQQSQECKEKARATFRKNLGVDYPQQSKSCREKSIRTCQEKYGTNFYSQSQEGKERLKEICIQNHGVANISQDPIIQQKKKETFRKKYGVDFYTQTSDFQEKAKETCLKKYGVSNYAKAPERLIQSKKTCQERYGVDNFSQTQEFRDLWQTHKDEFVEKRKHTSLRKYGVASFSQTEAGKKKIIGTVRQKYGVDYVMQNSEIRKKSLGRHGMTKSEKKLDEFLKNHRFTYKYAVTLSNPQVNLSKNYDFIIYNQVGEPIIALELDGLYFHGLLSDPDGKQVRGETDNERFLVLPEGVKFLAIDETRVEESFPQILELMNVSYDDWIQKLIDDLPKRFPYYSYSETRLMKDWQHLCRYADFSKNGHIGESIIKNFHPSIYHRHVDNRPSPYEAWNNKELLEKCVRSHHIYYSPLSSHSVLSGFDICEFAPKAPVFNPSLAKRLIISYLNEFDEVFDPFTGFSGRMLGVCAANKKYIGQNANKTEIKESKNIIDFLKLPAQVSRKSIFQSQGTYECLFTCLSHSSEENRDNTNQVVKSCDGWIDECLKRFNCKRYLFVVDETEKYKDSIVEVLENKSHFGFGKEYVIQLNK